MTPEEYLTEANRTWNLELSEREQVLNAALGLAGEAGETTELVKKRFFHGKEIPAERVLEEAGDCAYYLTQLLRLYGFTMEQAFDANIAKLRARHPEGFKRG